MAAKVYLERGAKRVFACALDWPGWCRSGKTEEEALDRLADYAARYAPVAAEAGARFPKSAAASFDVVERLTGDASTDFGVPSKVASADSAPVSAAQARRLVAFVRAAWTALDRVAAGAPAELRKGPRGGGRDRDKMLAHVFDAEAAYARMIGLRHRPPPGLDDKEALAAMREDVAALLGRASDGGPLRPKGWPARYAVRRIAWHALDHAWEMEDRS
jgi:hypothetical protein